MTAAVAPAPAATEALSAGGRHHRSFLRSSLIFAVSSFAAYCLSLFKTIIVTRLFGTSAGMDAFVLAVLVPNLLCVLLTGTASIALIPVLARAGQHSPAERANTFRSALLLSLAVTLAFSAALFLLAAPILRVIAPGLDPARRVIAIHLLRLASPLLFFGSLYALCSAELLSRRRYALVASGPAIATALSLAVILLFSRLGVVVLVYGLVIGTALQVLIFLWPSWRATRGPLHLHLWTPFVRQAALAQLPLMFVSAFGVANVFVDQAIAGFLPAGNVSALNYASTLNTIVMQVVVMAASWVALPEFSALAAARDYEALKVKARQYICGLALVAAPVCAAILVAGDIAIRLVFQHGAFSAESTDLVYRTWAGYTVGLLPLAIGMMAARLINALGENGVLVKLGLVALPLNAVLDYVLMQRAGCLGISLSTSFVYMVSAVILFRWARQRTGELLDSVTWSIIARAALCSAIAAGVFLGVRRLTAGGWPELAATASVACLSLYLLYRFCGLVKLLPADLTLLPPAKLGVR